jgi:hypothetical protein
MVSLAGFFFSRSDASVHWSQDNAPAFIPQAEPTSRPNASVKIYCREIVLIRMGE